MHYNNKLNKQAITNNIRLIKPIEKQKQIKLIIYYTKFKTSNLIVKNDTNSAKILLKWTTAVYKCICPFRECLSKNKIDIYIGYTTITLSRRLTFRLSENSTIKQHLIRKQNNTTNQFTSSDLRKSLTDNTIKTMIKNDYKSKLHKR